MLSGLRTYSIAIGSGIGLVLYLVFWFHWPVTLSLALGALMATVVIMTSASLGDAADADAAWRAAAPDLADGDPGGPTESLGGAEPGPGVSAMSQRQALGRSSPSEPDEPRISAGASSTGSASSGSSGGGRLR